MFGVCVWELCLCVVSGMRVRDLCLGFVVWELIVGIRFLNVCLECCVGICFRDLFLECVVGICFGVFRCLFLGSAMHLEHGRWTRARINALALLDCVSVVF